MGFEDVERPGRDGLMQARIHGTGKLSVYLTLMRSASLGERVSMQVDRGTQRLAIIPGDRVQARIYGTRAYMAARNALNALGWRCGQSGIVPISKEAGRLILDLSELLGTQPTDAKGPKTSPYDDGS